MARAWLRVVGALAIGSALTWVLSYAGADSIARPQSPLLAVGFAVSFSLPIWAILDGIARTRAAAAAQGGGERST